MVLHQWKEHLALWFCLADLGILTQRLHCCSGRTACQRLRWLQLRGLAVMLVSPPSRSLELDPNTLWLCHFVCYPPLAVTCSHSSPRVVPVACASIYTQRSLIRTLYSPDLKSSHPPDFGKCKTRYLNYFNLYHLFPWTWKAKTRQQVQNHDNAWWFITPNIRHYKPCIFRWSIKVHSAYWRTWQWKSLNSLHLYTLQALHFTETENEMTFWTQLMIQWFSSEDKSIFAYSETNIWEENFFSKHYLQIFDAVYDITTYLP